MIKRKETKWNCYCHDTLVLTFKVHDELFGRSEALSCSFDYSTSCVELIESLLLNTSVILIYTCDQRLGLWFDYIP